MSEKRSNLAIIIIGFLMLGYGAAFFYAMYEGSPARIIPLVMMRWRSLKAALLLSAWFIPALFTASAAAVSYSRNDAIKPIAFIRPILAPALTICILVSVAQLLLVPVMTKSLRAAESTSRFFKDTLSSAMESFKAKDYDAAMNALKICKQIDHQDRDYNALNDIVEREIIKRAAVVEEDKPEPPLPGLSADTAAGWYERALKANDARDFSTALYFIDIAITLSPRDAQFMSVRRSILAAISKMESSPEDSARARLYERKLQGYKALRSGDPLAAYIIYLALSKEYPEDPDVTRYVRESHERLAKTALFIDDAARNLSQASPERFVIVRENGGTIEIVVAERARNAFDSTYFGDLEYARFTGGSENLRFTARYARLRGRTVLLRSVDRLDPSIVHEPRFLLGKTELPGSFELPIDHETANRLLELRSHPPAVSLQTLWAGIDDIVEYGLDPLPYHREQAMRLGFPFAAFVSVLLGTAFGARFRRSDPPPFVSSVLGIIVIVTSSAYCMGLFNDFGTAMVSKLFSVLPPPAALTAWLVILSIAVVASLLAAGRALTHVRQS